MVGHKVRSEPGSSQTSQDSQDVQQGQRLLLVHMRAVILAGGLGTRLRPFTNIIPKALIPLSGAETILEIQIRRLEHCGFKEIFIATNYKADLIESYLGDGGKYGVRLTFSREDKPLGTCGPVKLLEDRLDTPFVLMNGDILTSLDFSKFYQFALEQPSILSVVTKSVVRPFNFGNVIVKDNTIVDITEKPLLEFIIVAGIYVLKPQIFSYIPENKYFGIDQLIRTLLLSNQTVSSYLTTEYWVDIGCAEDLEEATNTFKSRQF